MNTAIDPRVESHAREADHLLSQVADLPYYFADELRDRRLAKLVERVRDAEPAAVRLLLRELSGQAATNIAYGRYFEAADMENFVAALANALTLERAA